jgi:transmembrane protein TMEM260 (protein O-mannosyltransferase)
MRTITRSGACVAVVFVAFAIYVWTAYPTITWWDSSEYSLAAVTLGVAHAPGSVLLTVIGWIITRLPTGLTPAHLLNLLAGALAAVTVALVFGIATRLLRRNGDNSADNTLSPSLRIAAVPGVALGALTFAFSETLWQYAVQFTPYVLTAVFTGLLLWSMVRWWEHAADPSAWRWLFVIALLFGLDFSVHRTNILLLPGFVVWMLLRHPRTFLSWRSWASGASGMVAGLAFQLLLIPMAAAHPALNGGDPSNWSRFYDYVSLAQFGGNFLVQLHSRHAPLWSTQVMDLVRAFGSNWMFVTGRWGILGIFPTLFGIVGLVQLTRRDRRLGIAIGVLLVIHAAITVIYFNIPANFFRTFTRHYLPVFVTWAVVVAYGMGDTLTRLRTVRWFRGTRWAVAAILIGLVPLTQRARNWSATDASRRYFTEDYARNALLGLPPNAIVFTVGDNDTFPVWYQHVVGHVRPDVDVVNLSLTNATWYLDEIIRREPAFPLSQADVGDPLTRAWTDTTVMVSVTGSPGDFALPANLALPDSIAVRASPTMDGKYILRQDAVVLHILKNNRWRRPICYSVTVGDLGMTWLKPYRRLDGLFWRIVPRADPPVNRDVLRRNLLETYRYRGYAEPTVAIDDVSRNIGSSYYRPFVTLARAESENGNAEGCRQVRETIRHLLPIARLEPDSTTRRDLEALCDQTTPPRPSPSQ